MRRTRVYTNTQEKSQPFLPWRVGRKDIDTLLLLLVSLSNHDKTTRLAYKNRRSCFRKQKHIIIIDSINSSFKEYSMVYFSVRYLFSFAVSCAVIEKQKLQQKKVTKTLNTLLIDL